MRRLWKWLLPAAACAALLMAAAFYVLYVPKERYELPESGRMLSDNPSRGLYYQVDTGNLDAAERAKKAGVRLILLTFDIHEYTDQAISPEKLSQLSTALDELRKDGFQIIFRAGYGFESSYGGKDARSLEIIQHHIRQIAPLLNEAEKELLCVQAGFLGPWGEWHDSRLLGQGEEEDKAVRNQVLSWLLEELDDSVIIDVRRPRFIRDAGEAGLDTGRLGIHNDALLSTVDDMGTYDADRREELRWMQEELSTGINGGEMPMLSEYTRPQNVLEEFALMGVTYLNSSYNREVLEAWKQEEISGQNAYDQIISRLGYRFYVPSIAISRSFKSFQKLKVEFTLENTGFAAAQAGYEPYLTVRRGGGGEELTIRLKERDGRRLEEIVPGDAAVYEAELPIKEKEDFSIGLLLARDGSYGLPPQRIELANDDFYYSAGVNEIGRFIFHNGVYTFDGFAGQAPQAKEALPALDIAFLKIGKADAICLKTAHSAVLIDAGEDEDGAKILDFLRTAGIERLDGLILTHFDKDHVGGADIILRALPVETVWQPDYTGSGRQYEEYEKALSEQGIEPRRLTTAVSFVLDGVSYKVEPSQNTGYEEGEDNNYSLVTRVTHGENRLLFAGDAQSERLEELIAEGDLSHDLLKLPHHGRMDPVLPAFLTAVSPEYAVITCSKKKPPDEEVLEILDDLGAEIYLTMDGDVLCESDGRKLTIAQQR